MKPLLIVGNKNYSSWSLRAWLALAHSGVDFDERMVLLSQPDSTTRILEHSPSGKVPCLIDGELTVWDSLAICETANERYVDGRLWPRDADARARARAAVAEMHSSFAAVRTHLPMDIRGRLPERGKAALEREDVAREVARIQSIWRQSLERSGGPFLFGDFSIADAFFAPVVTRFVTYGVPVSAPLPAYIERVRALPALQRWSAAAVTEPTIEQ